MEKTLVLVKPDGVERAITGEIIARFERRGLRLCALKMLKLSREKAEIHYAEHRDKPFFEGLVEFITSGPVVAMVVGGDNVIKAVRAMMGTTDPLAAAPGTIRGDYALQIRHNIVHGSDSPASAEREISVFFAPEELLS